MCAAASARRSRDGRGLRSAGYVLAASAAGPRPIGYCEPVVPRTGPDDGRRALRWTGNRKQGQTSVAVAPVRSVAAQSRFGTRGREPSAYRRQIPTDRLHRIPWSGQAGRMAKMCWSGVSGKDFPCAGMQRRHINLPRATRVASVGAPRESFNRSGVDQVASPTVVLLPKETGPGCQGQPGPVDVARYELSSATDYRSNCSTFCGLLLAIDSTEMPDCTRI